MADQPARGLPDTETPVARPTPASPVDAAAVAAVIDELAPLVQRDGGEVALAGVVGQTVQLRMVGGCSGCPSAVQTMSVGIERILKDRVAGVGSVVAV